MEFSLDIPFTVPSDGEVYTMDLERHQMPAHYEYKYVPKIEEKAFLTAAVTDWQAFKLLDGEASLFFEETYLGKIPISTDRDIDVEPEALDGAQLEEETGIMTWRLQLAPNEQRRLRFSYSVKYPKGANVRLE